MELQIGQRPSCTRMYSDLRARKNSLLPITLGNVTLPSPIGRRKPIAAYHQQFLKLRFHHRWLLPSNFRIIHCYAMELLYYSSCTLEIFLFNHALKRMLPSFDFISWNPDYQKRILHTHHAPIINVIMRSRFKFEICLFKVLDLSFINCYHRFHHFEIFLSSCDLRMRDFASRILKSQALYTVKSQKKNLSGVK